MLSTVIVAPITTDRRGSHLRGDVGALDDRKMHLACEALAVATAGD